MNEREFVAWPKIARLENEIMTITEKIDGTNACVVITEGDVYAQSRTRIITPDNDNFGFAAWVEKEQHNLRADLGEGRFYGEWFGAGIQRRYGLDEKWFALFNAYRFGPQVGHFETQNLAVVPVLHSGPVCMDTVAGVVEQLYRGGSIAAPGFAKPEGVVVHLKLSRATYKVTDAVAGTKEQRS